MIVRWLGQASFSITAADGTTVRTDPFDESLGLSISRAPADVVTVSHDHFDHNATYLVPGDPKVVSGPGTHEAAGVTFLGVGAYHDEEGGAKRGENVIFRFEIDGVAVCHLGDLGHTLTDEQAGALGEVDVLLIPVGGTYTIDAAGADAVISQLKPRIVVPMHYKLAGMELPIAGIEKFLEGKSNIRRETELNVTADSLPDEQEIVVLSPA